MDVAPNGSTLWIADYGNHRVLRFRNNSPIADLVLGQRTMFTADERCRPDRPLDAICRPAGIRYDATRDRLYVLEGDNSNDAGNPRILVFDRPSQNGQPANAAWGPPTASPLCGHVVLRSISLGMFG